MGTCCSRDQVQELGKHDTKDAVGPKARAYETTEVELFASDEEDEAPVEAMPVMRDSSAAPAAPAQHIAHKHAWDGGTSSTWGGGATKESTAVESITRVLNEAPVLSTSKKAVYGAPMRAQSPVSVVSEGLDFRDAASRVASPKPPEPAQAQPVSASPEETGRKRDKRIDVLCIKLKVNSRTATSASIRPGDTSEMAKELRQLLKEREAGR